MSRSGVSASTRFPIDLRLVACAVSLLLAASPLLAGDPRSSLLMVEGYVSSVIVEPGEGGLALVAVWLTPEPDGTPRRELLLAPRPALDGIGFEVEVGDHLKARVFPTEQGPVKVHKVLNLTRRKMVKVRALSQIPLWDGSGAWQGGECQGLHAAAQENRGARAGPPR